MHLVTKQMRAAICNSILSLVFLHLDSEKYVALLRVNPELHALLEYK